MIRFTPLLAALLALLPIGASAKETRPPVTILVSIDGFRADYLDRGVTPTLSALAKSGIIAPMRPSFPSKTFPNHWALITGKVPDRNGIVANRFEDPRRPGEVFTMASDDPFWWNEAKPIWVAAEEAGIRSAAMFWPGSGIAWGGAQAPKPAHGQIGGTRPQDWQHFDGSATALQRVETVLDWMRRPAAIRPRFVTLYFDTVDTAGHNYGPDDARTTQAIAAVDADVARLVAGLKVLGQTANLVVVADHGMAGISSERVVTLDSIADPAWFRLVESGPFATIVPTLGHEAELAKALTKPLPHAQCWPREQIPARFHYGQNPRVSPFFCLAETGWMILASKPASAVTGGTHGYDNTAPEMAALFIATGPAIRKAGALPAFDNVDVTALLRDLIGLPADSDADGNDAPFRNVLRR